MYDDLKDVKMLMSKSQLIIHFVTTYKTNVPVVGSAGSRRGGALIILQIASFDCDVLSLLLLSAVAIEERRKICKETNSYNDLELVVFFNVP